MKIFKIIPIQLTIISILLIYFTSCNRQTQNNNSGNEADKPDSTTQLNSLTATVYSIDKNIRSIFQDKNGELWFGTNGDGICKFNGTTFTEFIIK